MNKEASKDKNNISEIPSFEIPTEIHQLPYGFSSGILYFQFERKSLTNDSTPQARISSIFPVIVMLFLILVQSRAYIFWYIIPRLEQDSNFSTAPSLDLTVFQLFLFVIFSIILLVSTILTIITPPGEVDEDLLLEAENLRSNIFQVSISEQFLEKMQKFGNCERKRTLFPRFCRTCLKIKPDRSHHCSVCNKCVVRMDHHCPYVNNCIGFMNYKYFMNMIISATICSVLISATMWQGVKDEWDDMQSDMNFQVLFGIVYFGNLVLSIVLVAFCGLHFYLIGNGLTTIEFREKMTVKFDKSPYDKGCFGNFLDVFGRNPVYWMVPISNFHLGNTQENVLTFEKNELGN